MAAPRAPIFDPKVTNVIGLIVAITWMVGILSDIFVPDFEPSPYLHAIMASIAGGIVGNQIFRGPNGSQ